MEIVTKQTAVLIPYINNARTHSTEQIKQIAASIKEFGFTNPILLDGDNGIIAGHRRVMAAELLKMAEVPCIELPHLTPAQKKAYILADNKLALNAGWDDELLEAELKSLEELDFDVDLTGFDSDELSDIFRDGEAVEDDFDVDAEIEAIETPVTKLGDIWKLGNHRLMCGDSTKDYNILIDNKDIKLLFTDPPYGVSVVGSNGSIGVGIGKGKGCLAKEGTYRPVIGDDTYFNPTYLLNIGEKQIIWGANYFHDNLPLGTRWLVWDKERPDGTTFSDCELAWTSIEGVAVEKYKCMWNGMIREGESGKRVHPTQKPLKLCGNILIDYSEDNDIILDLFGGSGSTLIACEQLNRICYMMELDEKYCDVIIKRWETLTGKQAEVIQNGTKQTAGAVL